MGHFPLEWLQQQLSQPGSSNSTLYLKLDQLLVYLNLPGSVLDWIPVKAMTLRHAKPMQFYYKAAAMQAVEDMLSFNPMQPINNSIFPRLAAFIVTTTDANASPDEPPSPPGEAPLLVRAVKVDKPELLASTVALALQAGTTAQAAAGHLGPAVVYDFGKPEITLPGRGLTTHPSITQVLTVSAKRGTVLSAALASGAAPGSAGSGVWEPNPWDGCAYYIERLVVSPKHPMFGVPLKEAVLDASSSLGLAVGTVTILLDDCEYYYKWADVLVFSW
jgi:hypothetical protein